MTPTLRPSLLTSLLFTLLLSGCPSEEPEGDDDDSTPFVPDLPTGGCGAPAYDWAPMERMGEIVDWEELDELAMPATGITYLLESNGISGFTPEYDVRVFRVRYLTQDRGEIVEATGLLSYPVVDEPTPVPSVAWLHGTTGFNDSCAPSADIPEGAVGNLLLTTLGFATASPDYLGLNGWGDPSGMLHPYVVAEPAAVASLDGLRALHRFANGEGEDDLLAQPEKRTVLWGGSEGGFAALFSDRFAPGYAPEFDIVADVALVPPTDPLGLATHAVTVPGPTTVALGAVLATNHPWYGSPGSLDEVLRDEAPLYLASSLPGALAEHCDGGDLLDDIESIEQVYQPDFVAAAAAGDWDAIEPWSCFLRTSTLGESPVPHDSDTPTLFVVSGEDDLVAADVVRTDYGRLCDQGYRMEYLECEGASHTEGAVQSLPYQWEWVQARLAGDDLAAPCVYTDPVDCSEFGLMEE